MFVFIFKPTSNSIEQPTFLFAVEELVSNHESVPTEKREKGIKESRFCAHSALFSGLAFHSFYLAKVICFKPTASLTTKRQLGTFSRISPLNGQIYPSSSRCTVLVEPRGVRIRLIRKWLKEHPETSSYMFQFRVCGEEGTRISCHLYCIAELKEHR